MFLTFFFLSVKTCSVHELHIYIIFLPSVKSRCFFFLVKEMQRSSIYFGSEYNLDNLYWCTDCRVLAAA